MWRLLTLLLLSCASTSHARTLLNDFNTQARALHGEGRRLFWIILENPRTSLRHVSCRVMHCAEDWEMSPAMSSHPPSPTMDTCPPIALSIRRVDVTGTLAMIPSTFVSLQCHTSSGTVFDPVTVRMWSANRVNRGVYTFNLEQHAATLGCGDAVSCKLSLVPANAVSSMDTQELIPWSVSSCWFLYSQFEEQGGNMWACQNSRGAQYVLQCANCTGSSGAGGEHSSDSDDDQHGMHRDNSVSPTVLILVLSIGAVLAVSIFLAILAYARAARRSGRRAERLSALRMGGIRQDGKPVPMYTASSDRPGPGNLAPGLVVCVVRLQRLIYNYGLHASRLIQ